MNEEGKFEQIDPLSEPAFDVERGFPVRTEEQAIAVVENRLEKLRELNAWVNTQTDTANTDCAGEQLYYYAEIRYLIKRFSLDPTPLFGYVETLANYGLLRKAVKAAQELAQINNERIERQKPGASCELSDKANALAARLEEERKLKDA